MKPLLASLIVLFLFIPLISLGEETGNKYPVIQFQNFVLPSGLNFIAPAIVYLDFPQIISEKGKIMLWADFYTQMYKISFSRLISLIDCESKFNPKAYNPKDIDGRPKYGLLQFDTRTFTGEDIWSWQEQLEIATKMMADGYWGRWPICSKQSKLLANKK